MSSSRANASPMNAIKYAGSFIEALRLADIGYKHELELCEEDKCEHPNGTQIINELQQAKEIYQRHLREAEERASVEMRQQGLDVFADALETGDYSILEW